MISTRMSFDPTWLLLSLIPSGVGFVLFVYGKKQGRWPHLVAGVALSIYPYMATTITMLVTVGALIGAGLWYAVRLGW
jgi:4-hydroxybenzoate polyprenyltransferase